MSKCINNVYCRLVRVMDKRQLGRSNLLKSKFVQTFYIFIALNVWQINYRDRPF